MSGLKATVGVILERAAVPFAISLIVAMSAALAVLCAPRQAQATAQFATQTGLPCSQCHADLNTPSKLTDFGQAFHANGDKVPEKK
jgi:hypothetical protein